MSENEILSRDEFSEFIRELVSKQNRKLKERWRFDHQRGYWWTIRAPVGASHFEEIRSWVQPDGSVFMWEFDV